jgi:signal transduction histidine kinase/CheY-like chemotaxis protein
VLISMAAGLLGVLAAALPPSDRSGPLLALTVVVALGGLFVGMADYLHGRSVMALVDTASALRQSAAERAADLARANAALRRRDDDRATLFATMSHELRTPLNAIIGFSRALLDGLDGDLTAEQRDDVAQIHTGGEELLSIVNGTLDLARLDAGVMTVARGPVQVWPVVEEVAALLRPLAAARGLQIDRDVTPGLSPVDADEARLRQVLVNLVGNAVKFSDSGTVTVRAQTLDDQVLIAVADTGVGISPEDQEAIFEPFRRGGYGRTGQPGGTGLGLAISKRLLVLMGGRIWVESERGHGSTFFVTLPTAAPAAALVPVSAGQQSGCDVVVVAEPRQAGPLLNALASHGYVAQAAGGPGWLQHLAELRPRLVLVDLLQSHADGWRALAELRAAPLYDNVALGVAALTDDGGRVALPRDLDVLAETDLETGLSSRVGSWHAEGDWGQRTVAGRVLVIGSDVAWRRQVCSVLESGGANTIQASSPADALGMAQRVPICGVVVDVRIPDPGIAALLSSVASDELAPSVPVLVVVPRVLSPRHQRDLHLSSTAWCRAAQLPMAALAGSVAETVSERAQRPVLAGEARWPAR